MKKMLRFVYILIVVMLTAYISSMFTHEGTSTWYQTLKKPAIVPPDIVFSIVWSIIYVLMILSVFMILLESAMIVFILRLEYNFKAMEIVLKKTLGYTLFERERVLFILTLTLSVISIILSIIIGALCSVKSISYLVGLGMMLTLIEISYMIYKMKQLERVKIVSVLKGEYV